MAMTGHRSVGTVMGYFQAGALLASRATTLITDSPRSLKIASHKAHNAKTEEDER